jgi:hypothetical protein
MFCRQSFKFKVLSYCILSNLYDTPPLFHQIVGSVSHRDFNTTKTCRGGAPRQIFLLTTYNRNVGPESAPAVGNAEVGIPNKAGAEPAL